MCMWYVIEIIQISESGNGQIESASGDAEEICSQLQDTEILPSARFDASVQPPAHIQSPSRINSDQISLSLITSSKETSLNQNSDHTSPDLATSPVESHLPVGKCEACSCGLGHLQGTLCFDPDKTSKKHYSINNVADGAEITTSNPKSTEGGKNDGRSGNEILADDSIEDQPFKRNSSSDSAASSQNVSDLKKQKHLANRQDLPTALGSTDSFITDLGSLIRESMLVVDDLDTIDDISDASASKLWTFYSVPQTVDPNGDIVHNKPLPERIVQEEPPPVDTVPEEPPPVNKPLPLPEKHRMVCWGNKSGKKKQERFDANNNSSSYAHTAKNVAVPPSLVKNARAHNKGAFLRRPYISRMLHTKKKLVRKTVAFQHTLALRQASDGKAIFSSQSIERIDRNAREECAGSSSMFLPNEIVSKSAVNSCRLDSEGTPTPSTEANAVPTLFSALSNFIQSARSPQPLTLSVKSSTTTLTSDAWKKVLAQAQRKSK